MSKTKIWCPNPVGILLSCQIYTQIAHTKTHTGIYSQTSERFQLSKYRLTGVAPESTGKLPTQCLNQVVLPLYHSELHTTVCTALTVLEIRLCHCQKMVCSFVKKCQITVLTLTIISYADISLRPRKNTTEKLLCSCKNMPSSILEHYNWGHFVLRYSDEVADIVVHNSSLIN